MIFNSEVDKYKVHPKLFPTGFRDTDLTWTLLPGFAVQRKQGGNCSCPQPWMARRPQSSFQLLSRG